MSDWCILRTSGRHTLPLASSLNAARFECWTPTLRFKRRLPRTKATVDTFAPIMATYVFARVQHFHSLLALEPVHPLFSIQRCPMQDGRKYFPFVADSALDDLRAEDYRWARQPPQQKPKARKFESGEAHIVPDGAWAGLTGIVERTEGKFVVLSCGNRDIKVAAWKLDEAERIAA